jgi:hypothetical protein
MVDTIVANIVAALPGLIPVLYTLVIAMGLDVLTGIWAAYSSGTLTAKFIPEFIQSHVVKKVAPIMLTLIAGVSVGGTDGPAGLALLTLAGGEIAAYMAAVVASVSGNLREGSAGTKGVPESVEPPPTD